MTENVSTGAGSILIQLTTDGLPPEVVSRIGRALQQTLLSQLADVVPSKAARIELTPPSAGKKIGQTDGMTVRFEDLPKKA